MSVLHGDAAPLFEISLSGLRWTVVLKVWDFGDPESNGTVSQVNRQKSAVNLVVASLDRGRQLGQFLDREKRVTNIASLSGCDCRDFSFVGRTPRKSFKPCMHIYRLAMELGLLEAKYQDHALRRAEEQHDMADIKDRETFRLSSMPRDSSQWGNWSKEIHRSGLQRNRQYRAYFIVDDEFIEGQPSDSSWTVHGYSVTLEDCQCADYAERGIPCKHIYAVAMFRRLPIDIKRRAYENAREEEREVVFDIKEDPNWRERK